MLTVTVCRKAFREIEVGCSACNGVKDRCSDHATNDLRHDIRNHILHRKAPASGEADSDRRVEMASRDMADGVSHCEHSQAEGERDTKQADADLREARCDDRAATTREGKPKGADGLGD